MAQEFRRFQDWSVQCDRQSRCVSQTIASGRTDAQTYTFTLRLNPIEDGFRKARITVTFENAEPGLQSPMIFQIDDGQSFRFEPNSDHTLAGNTVTLTDQDKTSAMIEALRSGSALYITFINPQLRETGLAFSLAGVTASLDYLSRQQSD